LPFYNYRFERVTYFLYPRNIIQNFTGTIEISEFTARIIILLIVIIALALMVQPEKLIYLSYFTAVLVILLGKLFVT